jgi:hypothetical protein
MWVDEVRKYSQKSVSNLKFSDPVNSEEAAGCSPSPYLWSIASYQMGTRGSVPMSMKLITHSHLMLRLWMNEALPQHPTYIYMMMYSCTGATLLGCSQFAYALGNKLSLQTFFMVLWNLSRWMQGQYGCSSQLTSLVLYKLCSWCTIIKSTYKNCKSQLQGK